MYTIEEKQYISLMYTMYANASNNTPSYTHHNSHVIWTVHSPPTPPLWIVGIGTQ